MFNAPIWAQLIVTVGTGLGVFLGVIKYGDKAWKAFKQADPTLANEIQHSIPQDVVKVGDTLIHDLESLAKEPWLAGSVAAGKLEVHHIRDAALKFALGGEIGKALAAAGKSWSGMSEIEKGTLLDNVKAAMAKLGFTVNIADITAAVSGVQSGIKALEPAMQDAAAKAAALQQSTAPVPAAADAAPVKS